MKQFPNLTLKRVQRRNRKVAEKYPEDGKVHKTVEEGSIKKQGFLEIIIKVAKTP